jgi:hypothetical protein
MGVKKPLILDVQLVLDHQIVIEANERSNWSAGY